ncbi:FecR domain-containing protein [Roseibium album]|uniref:FecR domain-containing protein n=1 Tax=Roseibium album TaxID=311410 RepID=UPI003BAF1261
MTFRQKRTSFMSAVSVGALVAAALLVAPVVVGGPAEAAVVKSVKGKNVTSRRITAPSNNVTEVLLEDGTVITLSPGASIDIVSFTYNGGNDGSLRLKINNGTVRISGGLANNRNTFTIETPQASIALDAGTALVAVSGGETKAHLLNGAGFTFTSNNRSKRIFRPGFKTTSNGGSPTRPARVDQREIQNDLALLKISVVPVRVLPRASAGNNQTANGLPPAGPDDDNITTGSINSSSSQQQQSGDPGLADEPVNLAAADEEDGTNGFDDPVNVNNPITVDDQTGQVTPVIPTPAAVGPVIAEPPQISLLSVSFDNIANGSNFDASQVTSNRASLNNITLLDVFINDQFTVMGSTVRASFDPNSELVLFRNYLENTEDFYKKRNGSLLNDINSATTASTTNRSLVFLNSGGGGFSNDDLTVDKLQSALGPGGFVQSDSLGAGFANTGIGIETEGLFSIVMSGQPRPVDAKIEGTSIFTGKNIYQYNEEKPPFYPDIVEIYAAEGGDSFGNSAELFLVGGDLDERYRGKILTSGIGEKISPVFIRDAITTQIDLENANLLGNSINPIVAYKTDLVFNEDKFIFTDTIGLFEDAIGNNIVVGYGDLNGAVKELSGTQSSAIANEIETTQDFDANARVIRYFLSPGLDSIQFKFDDEGFPVSSANSLSLNPKANGHSILGATSDLSPLISSGIRGFQSFETFRAGKQEQVVDTGILVVSPEGDEKFHRPSVFAHFDFLVNETGEGQGRIQDSSISATIGQLSYVFTRQENGKTVILNSQTELQKITDSDAVVSADVFAAGRTVGSTSGKLTADAREGSVSFTSGIFSTAAGGGNPASPGDGGLGFLVLENFGEFGNEITEVVSDGVKLSEELGVPTDNVIPGGAEFAVGTGPERDFQYGLLRLATAVGGLNLDFTENVGHDPRSFTKPAELNEAADKGIVAEGFAVGVVESSSNPDKPADGVVSISSVYSVTSQNGIFSTSNSEGFNTVPNLTIYQADGDINTIGGTVDLNMFAEDAAVTINLGTKSEVPTAQANAAGSVYISNSLFALSSQFDVMNFNRGYSIGDEDDVTKSQENITFVSSDFVKEGLPSNNSEFEAARTKDYKHVQWGFFFGDAFDEKGNAHHVHMGTFATGAPVDGGFKGKGTVRYDGHLIGNVKYNDNTYVASGTFTDTFDFATRRGSTAVQFDGRNFDGLSGSPEGSAAYASTVKSADNFTGTLSGNFVGGLNSSGTPNGLAGQFAIGNGGNYNAVGTFAADGTVVK